MVHQLSAVLTVYRGTMHCTVLLAHWFGYLSQALQRLLHNLDYVQMFNQPPFPWIDILKPTSPPLSGSLILVAYGIIPTLQDNDFGRIYAVYGGFFIVLSFLWGWAFDGNRPDRWDLIGSAIALAGVCFIMFMPRESTDPPTVRAPEPGPL
jgi:small multidrug resistance family-3 protein